METNHTIVVIDLEATCWEKATRPQGEKEEIIEIGYCPLEHPNRSNQP